MIRFATAPAICLTNISLSFGLLMDLRVMFMGLEEGNERVYIDTGWYIPLVLIGALWINDTMAYLVGSWFGKTPFSKISPKKNLGRNSRGSDPGNCSSNSGHETHTALQQCLELDMDIWNCCCSWGYWRPAGIKAQTNG